MANVFLSYDHEDMALARALAGALEKAGHDVWYDRHIHGGAQYSRKIEQALEAADAVVVLWSERSLDSAWVRDEAAEGRDRGKLVPLSIGGVAPPMGFRQFQTIELGQWRGRGKVPRLAQLLEAIENQATEGPDNPAPPPSSRARHGAPPRETRRWWPWAAGLATLLLLAAAGWWLLGRQTLPVVAVVAADQSARSAAGADDLYVKLGSLAQVGEGKWQLVDSAGADRADLLFRTADQSTGGEPRTNLVLLDGKKDMLLWSREFSGSGASLADIRLQMSLAAGQLLACALETRAAGGLKIDLQKRFLDACAQSSEAGFDDPTPRLASLRAVLAAKPRFVPAWERLLDAEMTANDLAMFGPGGSDTTTAALRKSIAEAEKVDPDMPTLMLAKVYLMPRSEHGQRIDALRKAVTKAPADARLHAQLSNEYSQVGRMREAVEAAEKAADLDPLSPGMAALRIMSLAYAGRSKEAERALAEANRRWAGTGAIRGANWAYHLRYGDPAVARANADGEALQAMESYLRAREGGPAAAGPLLADVAAVPPENVTMAYGWGLQALAEFGTVEDTLQWLAKAPVEVVEEGSYMVFRPNLAKVRRDRRFLGVLARTGLLRYWRESGKWPDFCSEPGLPYDCRKVAEAHA